MGDRVAVIRKGRLQQVDTPRNLYDHPDNLFVAGFIGSPSMNFVYGKVEGSGDALSILFAGERVKIDPKVVVYRKSLTDYTGKEVVIGIRPEAFELVAAVPNADPEQTINVKVGLVEQLGSEAFIHFVKPSPPVITPDIRELLGGPGNRSGHAGRRHQVHGPGRSRLHAESRRGDEAGDRDRQAPLLRQGNRRSDP